MRDLDILPAAERTLSAEDLNRTAADYPSERCIHELFEQQVRRAPEWVEAKTQFAVIFGERFFNQ
ncbi:hypothetical protein ACOJBO_02265 [Rhizobium beringeri]